MTAKEFILGLLEAVATVIVAMIFLAIVIAAGVFVWVVRTGG